jgi:hypothetical protein
MIMEDITIKYFKLDEQDKLIELFRNHITVDCLTYYRSQYSNFDREIDSVNKLRKKLNLKNVKYQTVEYIRYLHNLILFPDRRLSGEYKDMPMHIELWYDNEKEIFCLTEKYEPGYEKLQQGLDSDYKSDYRIVCNHGYSFEEIVYENLMTNECSLKYYKQTLKRRDERYVRPKRKSHHYRINKNFNIRYFKLNQYIKLIDYISNHFTLCSLLVYRSKYKIDEEISASTLRKKFVGLKHSKCQSVEYFKYLYNLVLYPDRCIIGEYYDRPIYYELRYNDTEKLFTLTEKYEPEYEKYRKAIDYEDAGDYKMVGRVFYIDDEILYLLLMNNKMTLKEYKVKKRQYESIKGDYKIAYLSTDSDYKIAHFKTDSIITSNECLKPVLSMTPFESNCGQIEFYNYHYGKPIDNYNPRIMSYRWLYPDKKKLYRYGNRYNRKKAYYIILKSLKCVLVLSSSGCDYEWATIVYDQLLKSGAIVEDNIALPSEKEIINQSTSN